MTANVYANEADELEKHRPRRRETFVTQPYADWLGRSWVLVFELDCFEPLPIRYECDGFENDEPPAEVEDVLYQYAVDAAAMEHTE